MLIKFLLKYQKSLLIIFLLFIASLIYSTHLSIEYIPKGYDLLFHLGNVFALQIKYGFSTSSLASFGISPVIFHDYGYGTHLFYSPLAHIIPALISFFLSKIGIGSTILALRLFSLLTFFLSALSMFFVAKKISNKTLYSYFASLMYISAPYLQMDYYWRGGLTSSFTFVFIPILLLSFFFFTKNKSLEYFLSFVFSMSLLVWTHSITALFSFILFVILVSINIFFVKNKLKMFLYTVASIIFIFLLTSPFIYLLLQQFLLKTHQIFSSRYQFTIEDVANSTINISNLFDLQIFIWKSKIPNLFTIFNLISATMLTLFIYLFRKISKKFKNNKYIYSLTLSAIVIICLVTIKNFWLILPNFFSFIQFPYRLLIIVTPIISLLIALPFILIRKISNQVKITIIATFSIIMIGYTFLYNDFEMYELGVIDYTTHSIIQAMGVEREYLPIRSIDAYESFNNREYKLIPEPIFSAATPSADIIKNETPYLLAEIHNNESKVTTFEIPRLYYSGYKLTWKPKDTDEELDVLYNQSENGLIETTIPGNGELEVQFTGGKYFKLFSILAGVAFLSYTIVAYRFFNSKKII